MSVDPSWQLLAALVALVVLAVLVSWRAGLGQQKGIVVAAVRAALQLTLVSAIIVAAIAQVWSSLLFVGLMFGIGVYTTCKRTGVRAAWPWAALAMAAGIVPVLLVIFGFRVAPFEGVSIIPIAGIITGNMMSAHTLTGRRLFPALREGIGAYEAGLAIGLVRYDALRMVTGRQAAEAVIPNIDTTRTVGLVTLPGAFIGVLLGGGSPLQAGAAQLLVLVGIMAGQVLTVATAHELILRAKLLPPDLKQRLRP
ncbi:ABC transporter permease [Propionibacteriaceae bacterium Y1923]